MCQFSVKSVVAALVAFSSNAGLVNPVEGLRIGKMNANPVGNSIRALKELVSVCGSSTTSKPNKATLKSLAKEIKESVRNLVETGKQIIPANVWNLETMERGAVEDLPYEWDQLPEAVEQFITKNAAMFKDKKGKLDPLNLPKINTFLKEDVKLYSLVPVLGTSLDGAAVHPSKFAKVWAKVEAALTKHDPSDVPNHPLQKLLLQTLVNERLLAVLLKVNKLIDDRNPRRYKSSNDFRLSFAKLDEAKTTADFVSKFYSNAEQRRLFPTLLTLRDTDGVWEDGVPWTHPTLSYARRVLKEEIEKTEATLESPKFLNFEGEVGLKSLSTAFRSMAPVNDNSTAAHVLNSLNHTGLLQELLRGIKIDPNTGRPTQHSEVRLDPIRQTSQSLPTDTSRNPTDHSGATRTLVRAQSLDGSEVHPGLLTSTGVSLD